MRDPIWMGWDVIGRPARTSPRRGPEQTCPNDTNGDGNCGRPACPYCCIGDVRASMVDVAHKTVLAGLAELEEKVAAAFAGGAASEVRMLRDLAASGLAVRREVVEYHPPGTVYGGYTDCGGPHGREGGEVAWACGDYVAAAGDLLPAPWGAE